MRQGAEGSMSKLRRLAERLARLLTIAILVPTALPAQDDAVQLLRRVSDTYKNMKSYHFESEHRIDRTSELHGSWDKGHTTLIVASPDRVRFENVESSGSYYLVSDGKTLWRATGNTREYSITPLTGPLAEVKGGGGEAQLAQARLKISERDLARKLDENLKSARILRDETLELQGRPVLCTVVRAEYSPPPGDDFDHSITRTIWIDKQRMLLLQEETVRMGNFIPVLPFEQIKERNKLRYTFVSVDEPLADSLFTYTPPENFREVDSLEPSFKHTAAKEFIGKPVPELTGKALDGTAITLSILRGKPVLLDFWATWCGPCRQQMPFIAKLYSETKDQGLLLLGVDDDRTPEKAIGFLKEHHYDWPSLFDGETKAAREKFKVSAIPTLVLIDKEGQTTEYQVGSGAETEKAIGAALQKLGFQIP